MQVKNNEVIRLNSQNSDHRMKNSYLSTALFYVTAGLTLCLYVWFMHSYALNVPYQDDLHDVLRFLLAFSEANSVADKMNLLIEAHNSHRTAIPRAYYALLHGLQGEIDFRQMVFIGNTLLICTVLAHYALLKNKNRALFFIAIALLIMCQPRAYLLLLWPMVVSAFSFVYAFAFLSIYLLQKNGSYKKFVLAIVLAMAAALSMSSGQLVWAVGLAFLLFQQLYQKQRNLNKLIVWLIVAAVFLLLFNSGIEYKLPFPIRPEVEEARFSHYTAYFFVLLGSGFAFGSVAAAIVIGIAVLALLLYFSFSDLPGELTAVHFYAWFLVCTLVAVLLGRAYFTTLEYALMPRYSFASLNLMLCLLVIALNRNPGFNRASELTTAIFALCFCAANYWYYLPLTQTFTKARIETFNRGNYPAYFHSQEETNALVQMVVDKGIYKPPLRPLIFTERYLNHRAGD